MSANWGWHLAGPAASSGAFGRGRSVTPPSRQPTRPPSSSPPSSAPPPSRATPRASSTTASTSSTAKVCIHSATRNLYGGWVAVAVIGGQRASSPPMLRGRSPICSCPVGRTDRRPSSKGSPELVLPPCYLLVLLRPLLEAGTSKSTWLTSSARRRTSSTSGWVATCQVSSACTCTTSSLASCPTSTR